MHDLVDRKLQCGRGAGAGREHADSGAGMPALADVLGPHAEPHARPNFVARDGRTQEIATAHAGTQFGNREQHR
jgi:hypothetical protein